MEIIGIFGIRLVTMFMYRQMEGIIGLYHMINYQGLMVVMIGHFLIHFKVDICQQILEKKDIYVFEGDYFKTNGEDLEFCKYLKKKNLKLFYSSKAICHHLQNDDAKSLSNRYWRYIYYGDGLKKRNFTRTLKNSFRQFKKTIIWSLEDIFKLRLNLIIVNFLVLIYFIKNDFKYYLKK